MLRTSRQLHIAQSHATKNGKYTDLFLLDRFLMKEVEGTLKDQPHRGQYQPVPNKRDTNT